jgi:MYND finger
MISFPGVTYCSEEHQSKDWAHSHKADCRSSDFEKSPQGYRPNQSDPSSPLISVLLPLHRLEGISGVLTNFINPIDRIKPESKSSIRSQCSKTIYGPNERFLVRARWGGHADQAFGVTEEDRRSGKPLRSADPKIQTLINLHMSCVFSLYAPYSDNC